MNEGFSNIVRIGLAVVGVVIIALALSASKTGAKIVQGLLVIAILTLVFRNNEAVTRAAGSLAATVSGTPKESNNVGGNREAESNES